MLAGRWYDGRTAEARAVRLKLCATRGATLLDLDGETVLARFALADIELSSPVGTSTRFLRLPDDTQLEVDDGVLLETALAASGRPLAVARRLEKRGRLVLVAALSVVLIAWLAYQYGIPALARVVADALPDETQSVLGGNALEQMDRFVFTASELPAEHRARLGALFDELVALSEATPPPRLELRGGGALQANAFALPDGTVVVTDELVLLAGDDDRVVAVMAHEIGHVDHRHVLRAVLQSSAVALLGAVVLGDLDSLSALAGAVPTMLAQASYSRDFEREADGYARELLLRAGRSPQALATMLDLLASSAGESADEGEGPGGYLLSHPPTPERLRALRDGGG